MTEKSGRIELLYDSSDEAREHVVRLAQIAIDRLPYWELLEFVLQHAHDEFDALQEELDPGRADRGQGDDDSPFPDDAFLEALAQRTPEQEAALERRNMSVEGLAMGAKNGWPLSARVAFDGDGRTRSLQLSGVFTDDPDVEITSRLVRSVPIHQMIEAARQAVLDRHEHEMRYKAKDDPTYFFKTLDLDDELKASLGRRPGRGGREDIEYARVAQAYAELIDSGARNPVEMLADRFGVSRSTARNWMHEARSRGLSARPGAGRSGGELTAKARILLDTEEDQ